MARSRKSKPSDLSKAHLRLTLNGEAVEAAFEPHKTLLEVLREDLGLTGTKHGCELGECGTCAVLVDGKPVLSCLVLGLDCEGRRVETVEGMAGPGGLHPLQKAFADLGAAQCGYCTPGFLLTAKALLEENPKPKLPEIREALAGISAAAPATSRSSRPSSSPPPGCGAKKPRRSARPSTVLISTRAGCCPW